jgi:hypothetical protein
MPQQDQTPAVNPQQIMQAIQQMLAGITQATSKTSGGPVNAPSTTPAPSPNISFNPSGAGSSMPISPNRPPATQIPQTGSQGIGEYATKRGALNAGLTSLGNSLSGMFGAIEQKEQAKKSALAENYMLQINALLASGDPQDKQKAMAILEDPKIRKILKTGLEYVPLEEDVPPEAKGVATAQQKIASGKAPQIGGGQQQQQPPQRRPIIPQASQQDQLKAAMTSALLQKIKQDPASAISMMGASQLSSAEEHAAEFYKAGLGLDPATIATMTSQEKLQGMKMLETATNAAIKGEVDLYKAQLGYKGKVDSATILANARKSVAAAGAAAKGKTGAAVSYAAGAKIYEDYAKKYLDIIKSGKGPDGKPLTEDQIKQYQQKADMYQQQADQYLNQIQDQELMEMFMKSIEEEPEEEPQNK